MKENPSIIFMGTPDFAVPTMEEIHKIWPLKAVVTVPDKPKGRGRKLALSPVKEKAIELGIPVLQPESLKSEEFEAQIKELNPDIIAVVAFRILPENIYSAANIASFNIHGSLLPKYRGAAPINHAIINGEKKTGLTSFILQKKVDTGDLLLTTEVDLNASTTAGDLHDMLMPKSAELAVETIKLLLAGDYTALSQDELLVCPAPKIFRDTCKIDWNQPAEKLVSFIHGVSPIPGAWTTWNERSFKILRCEKTDKQLEPGCFEISARELIVGTADYSIRLNKFQLQGRKAIPFANFARGYRGDLTGKMG